MLLMSMVCLWLAGCGQAPSAADSAAESATGQAETVQTDRINDAGQPADAEMTASEGETAQTEAAQQDEINKRVAKDGAQMQTEDKSMPTRVPMEGGTKINMYFGETLITGVLNDSVTAQALIEKLPVTQHVNRYSHDMRNHRGPAL